MPTITITDVLQMRVLPIDALYLHFGTTIYQIENLEQDSALSIDAVTQPTDAGSQRMVALKLVGKAIISQNNYEDLRTDLATIAVGTPTDVQFDLKALPDQEGGGWLAIGPIPEEIAVRDISCYWSIPTNDVHPRWELTVDAYLSLDVLAMGNNVGEFKWIRELSGFPT